MSKRELIQRLVLEGKSSTQIQLETGIPIATIRYHRELRGERQTSRISEHRRRLKRKAIDYSGSKCLRCGYDVCDASLTFHHLDQSVKEIGLSSGQTKSWVKFKNELDKTILLCQNCHHEHHSDLWTPDAAMIHKQLILRTEYTDKALAEYSDEHSSVAQRQSSTLLT